MAYVTMNGFDVEHGSSLLVYENFFPRIQHILGKGCIDKYTKTDDVKSITKIDVMRVLPYAPEFRQLGAQNNGKWHNSKNVGGVNNAPESEHYTIDVDLIYDAGVPITSNQTLSTKADFERVVMKQIIESATMTVNIVTFAKQIEAFFRDSFANIATPTQGEYDEAIFNADKTKQAPQDGSYMDAFESANAKLSDGIPEIGALIVPREARQAFVTPQFTRITKRQYMSNASEASAEILATGWINPFTQSEGKRVDSATGIVGMYDGVLMTEVNAVTMKFVYLVLGIDPTDANNATLIALLKQIQCILVYGEATNRGLVLPTIEANKHPFQRGVYIVPQMKMGVEVMSGKSIKLVVDTGWQLSDVTAIGQAISFTPIDGVNVTANNLFGAGIFNSGLSS